MSQLTNYCGTAVNSGGSGARVWANPANAQGVQNGTKATVSNSTTLGTGHLMCTNFGFVVPASATILGIMVEAYASDGGAAIGGAAKLVIGGVEAGTQENLASWSPEAWYSYGGAADLWGAVPTVAQVNDPSFGVSLFAGADAGGPDFFSVDAVRITVYYMAAITDAGTATLAASITTSSELVGDAAAAAATGIPSATERINDQAAAGAIASGQAAELIVEAATLAASATPAANAAILDSGGTSPAVAIAQAAVEAIIDAAAAHASAGQTAAELIVEAATLAASATPAVNAAITDQDAVAASITPAATEAILDSGGTSPAVAIAQAAVEAIIDAAAAHASITPAATEAITDQAAALLAAVILAAETISDGSTDQATITPAGIEMIITYDAGTAVVIVTPTGYIFVRGRAVALAVTALAKAAGIVTAVRATAPVTGL